MKPKLDIKKDIINLINNRTPHAAYWLPYVLKTELLDEIISIVDNAPDDYILDIKENPKCPTGMSLVLTLVEDEDEFEDDYENDFEEDDEE